MLPVGRFAAGPAPSAETLVALPLVGAAIGALAGGVGYAASLALPHGIAAALALATTVALSGAIHVDGFLDGCDAFIAAVPAERRLEILKDPRHGTFAVAGMFCAGLVWYAAIDALAPARYPLFLAFAGALARAAAVPNAFAYPYARERAVARAFVSRPPIVPVVATLVILSVVAYAIAPPLAALVPVAVAFAFVVGASIARRLGGGLVGDAYGFLIVLVEIVATVALAWAGARPE